MKEILSDWCDAAEHGNLLPYAAQTFDPTPDAVWDGINRLAFALGECEAKSPLETKLVGLVLREITQGRLAALIVAMGKHMAGKDWKPHLEKFGSNLSRRLKVFRPMVDELFAQDSEDGDQFADDGLDEQSRSLVWGGRTFSELTKSMMAYLKVLIEEYHKSKGGLHREAIQRKAKVSSGTKAQTFKVNRSDGTGGRKKVWHEVHEVVNDLGGGFYSMIDPAKVTAKVTARS